MRLTTVIICVLFIITALAGLFAAGVGIMPGLIVTLFSFAGIYAAVNIKN